MTNTSTAKIRILIVDDSASMRMLIRSVLTEDPGIEVVGIAADGIEAVEKAQSLKPDIITMDVEMPRMDGISALRQIVARKLPVKIIMISTLTEQGAKTTFEALDAGAFDFVPKSNTSGFAVEIMTKVRASAGSRYVISPVLPAVDHAAGVKAPETRSSAFGKIKISAVGIGASTGGPVAVQEVLSKIPADFPHGILVAIHMPKAFTGTYSERLNSKCALQVREAQDGDCLSPGVVLVAPGGVHTTVVRQGGKFVIKTQQTDTVPNSVFVPSIDMMLSSMAEVTGGSMLGVILTGMGSDGFKGMQLLKEKGGATIVQDETSSTIYGMPRVCIEGKVADVVLPLSQIGVEIGRTAA